MFYVAIWYVSICYEGEARTDTWPIKIKLYDRILQHTHNNRPNIRNNRFVRLVLLNLHIKYFY